MKIKKIITRILEVPVSELVPEIQGLISQVEQTTGCQVSVCIQGHDYTFHVHISEDIDPETWDKLQDAVISVEWGLIDKGGQWGFQLIKETLPYPQQTIW